LKHEHGIYRQHRIKPTANFRFTGTILFYLFNVHFVFKAFIKTQCLAFLSISSMSSSSIGGGGGYLEQHLQKTKKEEKQMFFEA